MEKSASRHTTPNGSNKKGKSIKGTKNKKRKLKTWHIVLLSVIGLLIIARLVLPIFLLNYVNKVLSEMEGYRGHVEDLDLEILKGGYAVDGFTLQKLEGKIPVPFISANRIAINIEYGALFRHFELVGELLLFGPKVNFVNGPTKETSQTGTEGDWTTPLKKLKTFTLNRVTISNGEVAYYDFHSKPKVDLKLTDLNLLITNLKNVEHKASNLPSTLKITATSIGKGNLDINGKLNVLKEIPDFDMNLKFTNVNLPALNDFVKAYGNFDFEKGKFNLFAEAALSDSYLKGYAQPMMEDVQVLNWKKDKDEPFFQRIWEGIVGTAVDLTENQRKDRFATKIPFEGNIKNMKTDIWATIINIFKNEFIKAFPKATDQSINYADAKKEAKSAANDDKKKEKKKKENKKK